MLNIIKNAADGRTVVSLEGRLDTVTAPELETAMKDTLTEAESLTLDFEKLEYVSSAGLRVILSIQKAMAEKGGLKVVNVNEIIKEIFDVTGFSEILTIE